MDPLLNSTSCLRNTSAPQISPYIRKYRKTAKLFTKLVLTVYQNYIPETRRRESYRQFLLMNADVEFLKMN